MVEDTDAGLPGLYIHFPFCRTRCAYCDFYSITQTELIPDYLAALRQEIKAYRDEFACFDTIYLGGGTPSLLTPRQIEAVLETIRQVFTLLPGTEITCEVNPADLGLEDVKRLHDLGITRINIGVQSFDEHELILLGRRHNCMQAMQAVIDARSAGFDNIGLDLIYSLPGQTLSQWQATLTQAISLVPSHLSCYELELKAHTPLGQRHARGELPECSEDTQREFFLHTSETLETAGYCHYEVSNFARGMDKVSRHNRKYWDHTPYLGLGPSAHSFKGPKRWWNHASLTDYVRDLKEGQPPVAGHETLSLEQLYSEALMLGFRTGQGINLKHIQRRFGRDLLQEHRRVLYEFRRDGLIIIEHGFIRPTRAGMAVADGLALL